MDSFMALGLSEKALYFPLEVVTPEGWLRRFEFPLRYTVDKIKLELFNKLPELKELSRLDYSLGLNENELLQVEFLKFVNSNPLIEAAIAKDRIVRIGIFAKPELNNNPPTGLDGQNRRTSQYGLPPQSVQNHQAHNKRVRSHAKLSLETRSRTWSAGKPRPASVSVSLVASRIASFEPHHHHHHHHHQDRLSSSSLKYTDKDNLHDTDNEDSITITADDQPSDEEESNNSSFASNSNANTNTSNTNTNTNNNSNHNHIHNNNNTNNNNINTITDNDSSNKSRTKSDFSESEESSAFIVVSSPDIRLPPTSASSTSTSHDNNNNSNNNNISLSTSSSSSSSSPGLSRRKYSLSFPKTSKAEEDIVPPPNPSNILRSATLEERSKSSDDLRTLLMKNNVESEEEDENNGNNNNSNNNTNNYHHHPPATVESISTAPDILPSEEQRDSQKHSISAPNSPSAANSVAVLSIGTFPSSSSSPHTSRRTAGKVTVNPNIPNPTSTPSTRKKSKALEETAEMRYPANDNRNANTIHWSHWSPKQYAQTMRNPATRTKFLTHFSHRQIVRPSIATNTTSPFSDNNNTTTTNNTNNTNNNNNTSPTIMEAADDSDGSSLLSFRSSVILSPYSKSRDEGEEEDIEDQETEGEPDRDEEEEEEREQELQGEGQEERGGENEEEGDTPKKAKEEEEEQEKKADTSSLSGVQMANDNSNNKRDSMVFLKVDEQEVLLHPDPIPIHNRESLPMGPLGKLNIPLMQNCEGFKLEMPIANASLGDKSKFSIEREQSDDPFYHNHFVGKDHINIIAQHPILGPVIISAVKQDETGKTLKSITRTKKGEVRKQIELSKKLQQKKTLSVKELLPLIDPDVISKSARLIKDPSLATDLEWYESRQIVKSYKFGVLYCGPDQILEEEMFYNRRGSQAWEEFLDFLGERIPLQGWKNYRAGLDVKHGTTGTHSLYTTFKQFEVMFHVSTLLPFYVHDKQQLERKRHLGNDIVVIVFKEGDLPYSPDTIKSEFNHVYFVVQKVSPVDSDSTATHYRISVAKKDGVPDFGPPLPKPAIFEKNETLREFLLCKLMNAERASYLAPGFKFKIERTRLAMLQELDSKFTKP